MKGDQFNQLVTNLRRDGVLTSCPLVHEGIVLSGNHRVLAAIKAGIDEADVIEVVGTLSPSRKLALQLSHNAITGQDDPSLLAALYGELEFDWKGYSGITDDQFKALEDIDISGLSGSPTMYQDLILAFLPEEANAFLELVKRFEKKARSSGIPVLVCHLDDFDRFFQTTVAVKEKLLIENTAMAIRTMATLAAERLAQLEANDNGQSERTDAPDRGADPQLLAAG